MDELLLIVKDLMHVSKRLYKYSPLGSNVILSVCETILSEITKANEMLSKNDITDNTEASECAKTEVSDEEMKCKCKKEEQKSKKISSNNIKEYVSNRQSTIISDDELKDAEQQVLEFIDKIKNELQF